MAGGETSNIAAMVNIDLSIDFMRLTHVPTNECQPSQDALATLRYLGSLDDQRASRSRVIGYNTPNYSLLPIIQILKQKRRRCFFFL